MTKSEKQTLLSRYKQCYKISKNSELDAKKVKTFIPTFKSLLIQLNLENEVKEIELKVDRYINKNNKSYEIDYIKSQFEFK